MLGLAAGVVAAVAPRELRFAVWGAVSEAVQEAHVEQLRSLYEHQAVEVRSIWMCTLACAYWSWLASA